MHQTTQRFVLYGANEVFITHPSLWCYSVRICSHLILAINIIMSDYFDIIIFKTISHRMGYC